MENNVKVQDDTQSLQSCVSVSVTELRIGNLVELDNKESWLSFANLPMIVTEIDSKLSQKEKEIPRWEGLIMKRIINALRRELLEFKIKFK